MYPFGHSQISMSGDDNGYQNQFLFYEKRRISKLLADDIAVTDGEFYYIWNDLFRDWFPSPDGWAVYQEKYVKVSPAFRVAVTVAANGESIQDGDFDRAVGRKLVLVGVVKSSLRWTTKGQEDVLMELERAMRETQSETGVSIVWGIAAIGFRWIAFKLEGQTRVEQQTNWSSDVLSVDSWQTMRDLVGTIKHSV